MIIRIFCAFVAALWVYASLANGTTLPTSVTWAIAVFFSLITVIPPERPA